MSAAISLRPVPEDDGVPVLEQPVHYYGAGTAVTELAPDTWREHRSRFGPRPSCRGAAGAGLIDALDGAGLTGRGGGHLPSAIKWRAARAAAGPQGAVVVANGAEGEPDSRKDAALLEFRPHLVLDGLVCAAETLGAREAVVWLHEGAHAARAALSRALTERPHDELPVRLELGPDRYLTGESGAIVQALSGGPALPAFRTVPAAQRGVHGLPTLVHNVDTLARVALLAREERCTSVLVTVCLADRRTVLEVPSSAPVQAVVRHVLGPVEPAALLLGGYGGSWCSWADLAGRSIAEDDLRTAGLSLGAGVLSVLPAGECGLACTATLARWLAEQSARQCGPCLFGLAAVADTMADLVRGGRRSRRDADRIGRFVAEIRGRGACHHPDGAVRMVASALAVFADDVAAHRHGRCLATGSRP